MLFWFKKKTITLDCLTPHPWVADRFKIEKATKFFPEWFKRLPRGNFTDPYQPISLTMKTCTGFLDYYRSSFAIPAWDYIYFRSDETGVEHVCESVEISTHTPTQYTGFLDQNYIHKKINIPWAILCKAKTKFIQTMPMWCYKAEHTMENMMHCIGVVDFYYNHSTNLNLFVKKPRPGESATMTHLVPGTPLVFYTPLDDVNIKFNIEQVSIVEYRNKLVNNSPTLGPARLKLNKQAIDNSKKCPFGFDK